MVFSGLIDYLSKPTLPVEPTHTVEMPIEIKAGTDYGEVIIPCAFYTSGFGVDLNPSLVKKKTGKKVRDFKVGEKVQVKPDEKVVLDKPTNEQEIKVLESCSKCGQKIVVSEIKEVIYRSCPKIAIRLSHKMKEDVVIPARFGICLSDVAGLKYVAYYCTGVLAIPSLSLFMILVGTKMDFFSAAIFLCGSVLSLHVFSRGMLQKSKWFQSVKHSLQPIAVNAR